jgi:hypothetical protein
MANIFPNADLFRILEDDFQDKGLSTGAIAGIVVAVVVFLALLAILVVWCIHRRKKAQPAVEKIADQYPQWATNDTHKFNASYNEMGNPLPQSCIYTLIFRQGTFSGSGQASQGHFTVSNGVINGSNIYWQETKPFGSKIITVEFSGTFVEDGTTILGSFKDSNGAKSSRFTMIRQSPVSSPADSALQSPRNAASPLDDSAALCVGTDPVFYPHPFEDAQPTRYAQSFEVV